MSIVGLKIWAAFGIFGVTVLSAWYPLWHRRTDVERTFPMAEAFASGIFLGAGLMHMLHEATRHLLARHITYPWPFLWAGATFLLLLWFEHLGREFYGKQGKEVTIFAILAVVMLSTHAFFAGAAMGASETPALLGIMTFAVLAHKWMESFALAVQIRRSQLAPAIALLYLGGFALMVPFGMAFGSGIAIYLHHSPWLMPLLASLSAGTFLYLGTLHGLKRAVMVEHCCNLKHFSFVILGFFLMAGLALFA